MRLLLVEDDHALAESLGQRLRVEGFAVDIAGNGIDAEHLGREEAYDVAVLDLGLPQKSGVEVLEGWRAAGRDFPVLVLTARDAWQDKIAAFKLGADDYVTKPFHEEEVIVRLQALIRRAHGRASPVIESHGLVLDENDQSLRLPDGTQTQLTAMEYRLLHYFLLNEGKVLSKSRLAEHLYEYDDERDSNVIEVYINRLRQLIGRERIVTRRGQGYVYGGPA
ncbi:MAG: response regulator transcription factor [Gammaproteobacteria bacterium]|nr:response regulator transcription factor [Gammaproteobacteria bacterium]